MLADDDAALAVFDAWCDEALAHARGKGKAPVPAHPALGYEPPRHGGADARLKLRGLRAALGLPRRGSQRAQQALRIVDDATLTPKRSAAETMRRR